MNKQISNGDRWCVMVLAPKRLATKALARNWRNKDYTTGGKLKPVK